MDVREGCEHPLRSREKVKTYGGTTIAWRCRQCSYVMQLRACAGCQIRFPATEQSLRHGRRYHDVKCRRHAARLRAKGRSAKILPNDPAK